MRPASQWISDFLNNDLFRAKLELQIKFNTYHVNVTSFTMGCVNSTITLLLHNMLLRYYDARYCPEKCASGRGIDANVCALTPPKKLN